MKGAIVLAFYLLDPFGMSRATDERSSDVFQRIFAATYAASTSDDITLVLLDDIYFEGEGLTWPLSLDEYSRLVTALSAFGPKAIFLDVLFLNDRTATVPDQLSEEGKRFVNSLKMAARGDFSEREISLIVGEGYEQSTLHRAVRETADAGVVFWYGAEKVYPLYHDGLDGTPRSRPSPAILLYQALCESAGQDCSAVLEHAGTSANNHLMIRWGLYPPADIEDFGGYANAGCPKTEPGFWQRSFDTLRLTYSTAISQWEGERLRAWRSCSPFRHISASTVLMPGAPVNETLRSALADKAVIVGVDQVLLRDLVQSPVHGELPGAFAHAMALDNLLNYGRGYYRERPAEVFGFSLQDLLGAALALAIMVFIDRTKKRGGEIIENNESPSEAREVRRRLIRVTACCVAAILVVMAVLWGILRLAPVNWIFLALFLLLVVPDAYRMQRRLADYAGQPKSDASKFGRTGEVLPRSG